MSRGGARPGTPQRKFLPQGGQEVQEDRIPNLYRTIYILVDDFIVEKNWPAAACTVARMNGALPDVLWFRGSLRGQAHRAGRQSAHAAHEPERTVVLNRKTGHRASGLTLGEDVEKAVVDDRRVDGLTARHARDSVALRRVSVPFRSTRKPVTVPLPVLLE